MASILNLDEELSLIKQEAESKFSNWFTKYQEDNNWNDFFKEGVNFDSLPLAIREGILNEYESITLQSTHFAARGENYKFANGSKMYIAPCDVSFLNNLQGLQADTKIELMGLTAQDMEVFIGKEKKVLISKINSFFKQSWLDRECGESVSFEYADNNKLMFGIEFTQKEILKKLKAGKLTIEQTNKIVEVFESGNEFYQQEAE